MKGWLRTAYKWIGKSRSERKRKSIEGDEMLGMTLHRGKD